MWLQYKRAACKLRRYIKETSRRYWDNVCWGAGSTGNIYKILKHLARKRSPLDDNIIWNSGPVASHRLQAELFLDTFSQDDALPPIPYDLSDGDTSLDAPFTLEELTQALSKTRPTSPGRDGISARLLQGLSHVNVEKLLSLYNGFFDSAIIPSSWREATIVPICKPGKPACATSSYHPIALTPVLAKVFERLLLKRLVSWAGRHNVFHPSHYGFMPFKDSTAALCKLYDDISSARMTRQAVFAVALDIKSAYDSIWTDGLIYKLAALGIRGKIGLWIARFLTGRSISVRWKSSRSATGACNRGVPQGSVLSPFLFLIFLADLFEVLESGVYMIIYADDIFLYAIGEDPHRTLAKLQNCLDRISQWCSAHHLSLSPDKCVAIDFSRRKMDTNVKVMGVQLDWSHYIKILGVWFARSLVFTQHFVYLRAKAFKRLNYIRAVVSPSRGVSSQHMVKLINSLIRSLLEYACPLFYSASRSALNALEVTYNAALRTALGLPRCTPLPLLRREAGASCMTSRLRCLTHRFFVRQASLPHPPFSDPAFTERGNLSSGAEELFSTYQVDGSNLIRFTWPTPCYPSPPFHIFPDGLSFQDRSLPAAAVFHVWCSWVSSIPSCTILASDASKDNNKTAIAAYNMNESTHVAMLVPHQNSIFSAETMAIQIALSSYVNSSGSFTLLTDSLSALRALQKVTVRSPRIIITLYNLLCSLSASFDASISLVWCPAHVGIPPNEAADSFARNGPYLARPLHWIAPEDLAALIHNDWRVDKEYAWLNCEYYQRFPHLAADVDPWKWTRNRREDVWVSRWRTRMWLTRSRLFTMNLAPSPLCPLCWTPETPDHVLLHCGKYHTFRIQLLAATGSSPQSSYSDIISSALQSRKGAIALLNFSSAVSSG